MSSRQAAHEGAPEARYGGEQPPDKQELGAAKPTLPAQPESRAAGKFFGSDGLVKAGLAAWIAQRGEPARRALATAVAIDAPTVDALTRAGIPHWDALELSRRLTGAGEVGPGGWEGQAREAYGSILATAVAPVPTLANPPRRALTGVGQLPAQERPREKALASGIEALDDHELLALLLRTGSADEGVLTLAQRLIHEHDGLVGLSRCEVGSLAELDGLGPAKAAEIAAAFELARRLASAAMRERPKLNEAAAVALLIGPQMVQLPHEELWCLPLDPRCGLIGEPRVISQGDVDGTDACVRAFFRAALRAGASSCIAVHNHPSGDPSPSGGDRAVTARLVAAGRTVELPLSDHIVIGAGGAFASIRRAHPDCFR